MDRLYQFQRKTKQREELRNKIYSICYRYVNLKSIDASSPDLLLNQDGYDLNDLEAPELMFDAGNEIGLPNEIINWHFPYLDYFECDEPKPLSIMLFADILIDILENYQQHWRNFKEKPQQEQEIYYDRIYKVIEQYLPLKDTAFSPDMIINVGNYKMGRYKTKRMVMKSAGSMGLDIKRVYYAFDSYFKFPIEWWLLPIYIFWGVIIIIFGVTTLVIYLIFYACKWVVTKKWDFVPPPKDQLDPLTVKEFASKIIGL